MKSKKSYRPFQGVDYFLESFPTALVCMVLCFLLPTPALLAQPALAWENAIGGTGYDELRCLRATADGGMILACTSPSSELTSTDITEPTNGAGDYWIVKMNADGTIAWDRRIGGSDFESAQEIQITADGGYIIGGFSKSDASGHKSQNNFGPPTTSDIWIAKLDAAGNLLWEQSYGGTEDEELYHIQETSDGGYILGGFSSSGVSGTKTVPNYGVQDFYVIKIDATGQQLWDQSFGGTERDVIQGLDEGLDGSFYFGGYSESSNTGTKTDPTFSPTRSDYWVVKTDANGNMIWDRAFGGDSWDQIRNIKVISDGNIILGGFSKSGISGNKTTATFGLEDMWVIKLNPAGSVIWQQNYGGLLKEECTQVSETSCGELLLGGFSRSPISGNKTSDLEGNHDYWIVKTDYLGNKIWDESYGGDGLDVLYDFKRASDGGFLLGGVSYSDGTGDRTEPSLGPQDVWTLKLTPEPPTVDSTFMASGSCFPADTGIIVNLYANTYGCDSVVVDTVTLLTTDSMMINNTSCVPMDTGQVISYFTNTQGCDSIIITTTTYVQADTTEFFETSCSAADTGQVVTYHLNTAGCDSLVFVNTALVLSYESYSSTISCDPNDVGIDTLMFTSTDGCDSLIINEVILENFSFTHSVDNAICFDGNEGSITIDTVFGGMSPYSYSINGGPFDNDNSFQLLSPGTYLVNVLDVNDCQYAEAIEIDHDQNFQLSLPADTTIALGDSLWLSPFSNFAIDSFTWQQNPYLLCDTCLAQYVKPMANTSFTLTGISADGCMATASITVRIDDSKRWYIPNAFSPNDDGYNDQFKIFFDSTVESMASFKVYDRWGGLVYAIDDVDLSSSWGWDGRSNGKNLTPGVFVFVAELNFADGANQVLKGDVLLVR